MPRKKRNTINVTAQPRPRMVRQNLKNAKTTKKAQQPRARGLLSTLGGLAGGYLGGPIGSALGAGAGELLAKISGYGAYTVSSNTLVGGQTIPSFRLSSDGVEICHREFIKDIVASSGFVIGAMAINPGLSTTFPFLSRIAQNFEEYEMLGLVFEYRPLSGTAISGTNSTMGTVVYATDYNVLAPNFVNKQQMESYEFSSSCVPYNSMIHAVECARGSNPMNTLYVRSAGSALTGADLRLYDMGKFQVATVGQQSAATAYNVGELWVSYHIRLKRPRISDVALEGNSSLSPLFACIRESPDDSATGTHPFGTTVGVLSPESNLVGVIPGLDYIEIQTAGKYYLSCFWSGTSIGADPVIIYPANISASDAMWFDESVAFAGLEDSGQNNCLFNATISVDLGGIGVDNRLEIGGLTGMTGATVEIFIFPLPQHLSSAS